MTKAVKIPLLSALALIAFAGNSVLCRLALIDGSIDPASFTSIRLFSGVLMLFVLTLLLGKRTERAQRGSWLAGLMLFVYATLFSFSYVNINTATGALVLFGAVQLTLVIVGLLRGDKLNLAEYFGMIIALLGFVYLVSPELTKPPLKDFIMMAIAGVAWAGYTLLGQGSKDALRDTAYNFFRTVPLIFVLSIMLFDQVDLSYRGVWLAMASGAITSGVGYAIWYAALRGLSTTQAAVIQLLVPIIAALGGLAFAGESISLRLTISAALVLGGIAVVIWGRQKGVIEC